jgi:hypothetical protein
VINHLARSYTSLGRAILRFPKAPWQDALSHGQLQSKAWALNELVKLRRSLGLVYVVGGWLGTLPLLMFETKLSFKKVRSFDIDPKCEAIADQVNIEHVITDWRFKAVTMDMFAVSYGINHRYEIALPGGRGSPQVETCNTVINTCCDHIKNFSRWWSMIPKGKLVVLQNNDFVDRDHVNIVKNPNGILAQAPMTKVLFKGTLPLAKYSRFMVIGVK